MKKILIALLAIILSAVSSTAKDEKDAPKIHFIETVFDFGTIREADGPVSHDFEFDNAGSAPLVILKTIASCGCTKPQYPKAPLNPGKSDKIKVTFNPAGRPGEFDKTINVTTNDPKNRKIRLRIKGNVIPKN